MPTPLTDADKVLRNDTGIDIATNIASIASALTPSNITDLGDVNLTNPITDGQVIKYDTATQKWVNGLGNITMECTQAQYDAWKQSGQLKPNTLYVITDAPNLNATAQDLSYDGGATSTHDVIEGKVNTSDIDTTLSTTSPNPIANSAVATAINGIGFKKASISAGNKTLTDLQAFCKTGEKGLLWAMPYVTTPSTGWAFVIFANKIVSDSHAEIYIFFNDKITSSYTSNLSATTPTWTTKSVTLS